MNAQERLNQYLFELTENKIIPAVSVALGRNGRIIFSKAYGKIYETGDRITENTRFDIASITKAFSGLCFMHLVEKEIFNLDEPLSAIFPRYSGKIQIEEKGTIKGYADRNTVTWKHVLTHTTGMGWARPKTRPSLPNLPDIDDIFDLPFVAQPGKHIIYTDIPIILMGAAMEKRTHIKLDQLIEETIIDPLKLRHSGYLRVSLNKSENQLIAPTEYDDVFRKRRIWGQVHDENAFLMDGVSAHAGIFSTATDICRLMIALQECISEGDGFLSKEISERMIAETVSEEGDRRGLIWQLSGRSDSSYTGSLSEYAYGHDGFTGCFVWNDPLPPFKTIVFLSNDVYSGRENRKLFSIRRELIRQFLEVLA